VHLLRLNRAHLLLLVLVDTNQRLLVGPLLALMHVMVPVGDKLLLVQAPTGGVTVAIPERGALAGPSAPTSTSTRWALVTM
jgi:hypothetical protein